MRIGGRERMLISLVLVAAMVGVFYLFVYTPKTTQLKDLQARLDQRLARLRQMEELAAQREALEREFETRQQRIQAIEAKLPAAREIPALLRQMQAVAGESGVKLTLLRPGPLEAPSAGLPGAAPPPAPGGQPAGQPGPAAPPYQLFKLELGFEGTYEKALTFLRRLENFPRFIAMTQITLSIQELPNLRLGVTSNTFVLPEGTR
ncbi:MAG: type 4a pilus biogenesis protein PilO [Armatimonadetes bacterium]|nr:type 4a pilus biogenesis protein PilO [Armatimonadota bacterium]